MRRRCGAGGWMWLAAGWLRGRACCGRSGRARRGIRTCRGEGRISQDICAEGTAKVRGGRAPTAQAAGAGTRPPRQERARVALRGGSGRFGALRSRVRRDAFLAPGCSIIRASLTVALMVSLPRFGSLWAFGPTAHRADASLRALRALATLGPSPVRRKDGPCHSERRVGMGPARKRADTKKIKGTARAALQGPHVRTTAQRGRPLTAAARARRRYVGY